MRHVAVVLLALMLTIAVCSAPSWSQEEPPDASRIIQGYSWSITSYLIEDQMRDLAENRRDEGLRAFEEILEHADEYAEYLCMNDVLGAMVAFFGRDEPVRIFRNWLLHTHGEHAVSDLRTGGAYTGWAEDREWTRQLYEEAAREADSEAVRYAIINALDTELTGEDLDAYMRSDEGLYEANTTAHGQGYVAVKNLAGGPLSGGGRPEVVLRAMGDILTYHHEHYDIFYLHRAMFLWFLDRDAEALADLDAYIDLHPEAPYPYHLRARVLAEMGNTEGVRVAEAMYLAKTEAVEPLEIELPDLPDELLETDIVASSPGWREFMADPDSVKLAQAVASSNADAPTQAKALKGLQERFDPRELGEAVARLELAVRRRLLTHGLARRAAELLGSIAHPGSAAVVADLALDDMRGGPGFAIPVERVLLLFPADVARYHLLWVAVQKRERRCFRLVDGLYGPERRYWQAQWELIVGGRPEERLAAAASKPDLLGALTLYETATDASLDADGRADALQALRDYPNIMPRALADLVERAQAAGGG